MVAEEVRNRGRALMLIPITAEADLLDETLPPVCLSVCLCVCLWDGDPP